MSDNKAPAPKKPAVEAPAGLEYVDNTDAKRIPEKVAEEVLAEAYLPGIDRVDYL